MFLTHRHTFFFLLRVPSVVCWWLIGNRCRVLTKTPRSEIFKLETLCIWQEDWLSFSVSTPICAPLSSRCPAATMEQRWLHPFLMLTANQWRKSCLTFTWATVVMLPILQLWFDLESLVFSTWRLICPVVQFALVLQLSFTSNCLQLIPANRICASISTTPSTLSVIFLSFLCSMTHRSRISSFPRD